MRIISKSAFSFLAIYLFIGKMTQYFSVALDASVESLRLNFGIRCCTVELLFLLQCYNILADVYLSNVKILYTYTYQVSKFVRRQQKFH